VIPPPILLCDPKRRQTHEKTKFIVKVNHGGTPSTEYLHRIDRAPIRMTTDRKLALLMGR
jgi:hypothetical protein